MAKFEFKFQSLLNIKTQLEDNLKNILAREMSELRRLEEILEDLNNDENDLIKLITTKSQQGITVDFLKKYNSYLSFLKEKINNHKEKVNIQSGVVDKYRGELVKAMQERKVFEKLREKALEQHLRDQIASEQKVVEEVVSYKNNPNVKQ